MNRLQTSSILVLCFMFLHMLPANAMATAELSDGQRKRSNEALNNAIVDLEMRPFVKDFSSIIYRQTLTDTNGNKVIRRFDPRLASHDENGQLLSLEGEDISTQNLEIELPRILLPRTVRSLLPILHQETSESWVFQLKTDVQADSPQQSNAEEIQDAERSMRNNLQTLIWVDKQKHVFTKLQVINIQAFRPTLLAKVEVFEVTAFFKDAWKNGPLVATRIIRQIQGSYGLFISIDEEVTEELSDMEYVNSDK